jgi:hypothetical protein
MLPRQIIIQLAHGRPKCNLFCLFCAFKKVYEFRYCKAAFNLPNELILPEMIQVCLILPAQAASGITEL